MSGLQLGQPGPLVSWLATYAVHSTLLLGLTWLVLARTLTARTGLRDALWKTALVGGLVTATLQTTLGVDPVSGRWQLASFEAPADPAVERHEDAALLAYLPYTISEVDAPVPQAASGLYATSGTNGTGATLLLEQRDTLPSLDAPFATAATASEAGRLGWQRWTALGWLALGSTALLGLALSWRHVRRSLRGRRRIHDGPLPGLLGILRARGGVRRRVRLYECPNLDSPIAMGTVFPTICLPERVRELPSDMQESILAHELAHVARLDPLWLIVARTIETAFFFQPLNRLARRELQQGAELLCDDWAVARTKRPIVLARSLAEVAGWLVGERPVAACGMVAQRSVLGTRVSRLLNERRPEARSRWTHPLGALLVGTTALFAPGFADDSRALDADERDDGFEDLYEVPVADLPFDATAAPLPSATAGPEGDAELAATLAVLADELSAECDRIALSLAGLRGRIAGMERSGAADASVVLSRKLMRLEERAEALLARKVRMNQLMALWQSTPSMAGTQQNNPEKSR